MQLICAMPVIHFKPVKQGKKEKTKGSLKTWHQEYNILKPCVSEYSWSFGL